MTNHNKLSVVITVVFGIILLVTAIDSISSGQWKNISLTLLAIGCLILPFIITHFANIKNIVLPSRFQLITLIFIFMAQYLGEIEKLYQIFWWWDLLLHAIFGSYAVIIALYLIKGTVGKEQTSGQKFAFISVIFAFSFSITLSTLWEMFEFTGDYLFKTHMVKGGLEDTATDLLITILTAFITSVICYFHQVQRFSKYLDRKIEEHSE